MKKILELTLSQVIQHFRVHASEIFLREEESQALWLALHRGESASSFWSRECFKFGKGLVGRAAQANEIIESEDLSADTRFLRTAVVEAGFTHLVCVPLRARDQVVGVLSIASREGRKSTQRELDLLDAISTWVGTAIENARLQQKNQRLAILEERERIGMDLHDGIIQSIYSVGLALDYARLSLDEDIKVTKQKINESIDSLNSVIQDIRAYILDLRPRQLRGGETLPHGMQRLVDEFRNNTDAKASLATSEEVLSDLPRGHALALFHICQESLANVARHARAEHVEVQLWTTDSRVLLKVSDDGRGFEMEKTGKVVGHGLSNMQRRVRRVGGDVEISSQLAEGTTVLAWVPWEQVDTVPEE